MQVRAWGVQEVELRPQLWQEMWRRITWVLVHMLQARSPLKMTFMSSIRRGWCLVIVTDQILWYDFPTLLLVISLSEIFAHHINKKLQLFLKNYHVTVIFFLFFFLNPSQNNPRKSYYWETFQEGGPLRTIRDPCSWSCLFFVFSLKQMLLFSWTNLNSAWMVFLSLSLSRLRIG